MLYNFDIPKLVKRYAPGWFRKPRNLQFTQALLSWPARIHTEFLLWRQQEIIDQYRFNGLVHSLEWALNDRFDPIDRRIFITVIEQVPFVWHLDDGEPSGYSMVDEADSTGYYYLDESSPVAMYRYEFLVNVPTAVSFVPKHMFDLLDLYRYAGRRPAIRLWWPTPDVEVDIIYYPGLEPAGNSLTPMPPPFETE